MFETDKNETNYLRGLIGFTYVFMLIHIYFKGEVYKEVKILWWKEPKLMKSLLLNRSQYECRELPHDENKSNRKPTKTTKVLI